MRTSLYLVGFAAVSLMSAGAVGFGCSSSSSNPTTPTPEASTGDEGTVGDGSVGGDGSTEPDAEAMEASVCVPAPVNIATFDAGAAWSCTQAACADGGLAACGADCTCNTAIFSALLCVNDAGAKGTVQCFTNAITPVYSDPVVQPFAVCLQSPAVTKCTAGPADGGDAGTDGGVDAATDSGTITDGAADGGG